MQQEILAGMVEGENGRGRPRATRTHNIKAGMGTKKYEDLIKMTGDPRQPTYREEMTPHDEHDKMYFFLNINGCPIPQGNYKISSGKLAEYTTCLNGQIKCSASQV